MPDDSPPSIRIKVGVGSASYEPSGVLAVLPGSTIHLDCMYPRRRGSPEWTWTGWFRQYLTGKQIFYSLFFDSHKKRKKTKTSLFYFIVNGIVMSFADKNMAE